MNLYGRVLEYPPIVRHEYPISRQDQLIVIRVTFDQNSLITDTFGELTNDWREIKIVIRYMERENPVALQVFQIKRNSFCSFGIFTTPAPPNVSSGSFVNSPSPT